MTVALLCTRAGMSADTVAAALLHDVVEDTDMGSEELAAAVSAEVAGIVMEVTKEEAEGLSWVVLLGN